MLSRTWLRTGLWHIYQFGLLGVETVDLTETTAQIRWTMSEVCTGQVEYGLTSGYGSTTTEEPIAGNHSVHLQLISGLTAGTFYHYRTKSTNAAGVTVYSDDQTFTTDSAAGITYTDYSVTGGITTIAGLQAYIATVPNGADSTHHSRILLGAGNTYTGPTGLAIAGLAHMTFEGGGSETSYGHTGGAVIDLAGSDPAATSSQAFRSAEGAPTPADDLVFHALSVLGTSTNYASLTAGDGGENQAAWGLYGATNITIDHCMADKVKGDLLYVASLNGSSGGAWCSDIWVHHSTCSNNGRMGIGIIAVDGLLVEYCRFTDICYAILDIEPNVAGQGCKDVEMSDCLIDGTYFSWDASYNDGCFVTANAGLTGVDFSGYLKIIDNTISAAMEPTDVNQWIGHFRLYYPSAVSKTATLTITGNTCTAPKAQYACLVGGFVNGGTITGNTGFLTSGTWYYDIGGNGTITRSGNT